MATATDWKYPSTQSGAWADPTNMYASDNAWATANDGEEHGFRGFGFDGAGGVPANATIVGWEWRVEGKCGGKSQSCRISGRMLKDAGGSGDWEALTDFSGQTEVTNSAGGDGDMQGNTLTPTEARSSGFGIYLSNNALVALSVFYGDHVAMRLWYELLDPSSVYVYVGQGELTYSETVAPIYA